VSRALPRAFEYDGNSVALRVSPGRRSRLDARETLSTCRPPVRPLSPVHCRVLIAESVSCAKVIHTTCDDIASGMLR
jgi:hypothetical protein